MTTKVLLWQTVDKLGKRGDQVSVSDGYARNYLYPRKLATPATAGQAREFKAAARKAEKHEGDIKRQYSDLAAQIGNTQVTIEMLANNEGVLFGGVTPSAVAEALKRAGMEVNGKFITIGTAIKRLGDYTVTVRFHPEVQAKLKVTVTASKAESASGAEPDEENPFTKGISVDEAEKHDPKMRGKRPKKMKEGKEKEGKEVKKEGAAEEGAAKAEGEKKAEVKEAKEEKPAKAEKSEKPEKKEKK